jgi:hypothetical protein
MVLDEPQRMNLQRNQRLREFAFNDTTPQHMRFFMKRTVRSK